MFQIGDWRWRIGDLGAGCVKSINALEEDGKRLSPSAVLGIHGHPTRRAANGSRFEARRPGM
jgi:hypothetical protein